MSDRKIAFVTNLGFASQEPAQVLDSLADAGYQGVEWTMAHFNPREKSPQQLLDLVEQTHSRGLEISDIVVQQDLVSLNESARLDRVEMVKECIKAAGDCGVGVINLFTGPAPWDASAPRLGIDITQGQAWEMVWRAFDEFIPLAEKHKVILAVEAVFEMLCKDYYTLLPLMDRYGSKNLGIVMDPSHYALYRNDIPWAVSQWGKRIKHVHLKDVIGVPGTIGESFMFPLLGEGMVDWKAFTAALDGVGYDGWLSVEFESFNYYNTVLGGDPAVAARLSMEAVKRLL